MKKTDFITFRTDKETKEKLQKIADEKKWTISQTCEILLQEQLKDKYEGLYESVLEIIGYEYQSGHLSEKMADKLENAIQKAKKELNKE